MNEPLDPPDEIDDTPRDEEIAALKEDVKALRGLLRRVKVALTLHSNSAERFRSITEIDKELENYNLCHGI